MPDMFLVGGAVRDLQLGLSPKDFDFTVQAPSFEEVEDYVLHDLGAKIFLSKPEYGTVRAQLPREEFLFAGYDLSGRAVDFVWARKDGYYSDGRRPDSIEPGSLYDDLARRDFTVNAMALDKNGTLIDPFSGADDLAKETLRAVGDPTERLTEDALRVFRALRFSVTKDFSIHHELEWAIQTKRVTEALKNVSTERIREELHRMFAFDSNLSFLALQRYSNVWREVFSRGIWFLPTLEKP